MESRKVVITTDFRIWFSAAQFPALASQDIFSGKIGTVVRGYTMHHTINSDEITDRGLEIILDGGLAGDVTWEQGASNEVSVTGFIEKMDDEYCVIHPEKISD